MQDTRLSGDDGDDTDADLESFIAPDDEVDVYSKSKGWKRKRTLRVVEVSDEGDEGEVE
jgi:hypothetical protein